ncbi:MAG TPA: S-adenosylmethionine:tRNA ribosyltransferase-isomerase [Actinomycetota bacterium]|nr:S-adenosylmethionine:tRNA ribosyltransferase-isomerase [Actinomycetota bacterium]
MTATFTLPVELSATEPPEARSLARDEVRLLVAEPEGIAHSIFRELPQFLAPGDLVLVNTSMTVPAAVEAFRACDERIVVHLSSPLDDGTWAIELRRADGSGPIRDAVVGETVYLAGHESALLVESYPDADAYLGSRLWRARLSIDDVPRYLTLHGRPITYGYLRGAWPLDDYQTVFARESGSAEMPSAARPFTNKLVTDLVVRGIAIAPITLHAGVSSLDAGESPLPERFKVSDTTTRLVNHTRRIGGRVVAIGTTVARALETIAYTDGTARAGEGWTDLVLGLDRPARVVTGLVTGWHPAGSSHLALLEAVAGRALVRDAYDAAREAGYLWHEFGDSCLLLPARQ